MNLPISHYQPQVKRSIILRVMTVTIIVGLLLCISNCFAQNKPSASKLPSPDVLVLVLDGMGPYDQVSINYAGTVSKTDAQKDLMELSKISHWVIQNQSVSTQAGSMPGAKQTTSAAFQTMPVVDKTQGTLPIEPFIVTLKRFKNIQINYLVASKFTFQGLKNYENDNVKINLRQSGNSYLYTVGIKNSDFERLDLPLKAESGTAQKQPMPLGARILLIIGLALVCAVIVYFVVAYLTRGRVRS